MEKMCKIRKEYGSFKEAVRYYAALGCSRSLTARQLNLDRGTLRRWIKKYNLNHLFKPRSEMVFECRRGNENKDANGRFCAEKSLQNTG